MENVGTLNCTTMHLPHMRFFVKHMGGILEKQTASGYSPKIAHMKFL